MLVCRLQYSSNVCFASCLHPQSGTQFLKRYYFCEGQRSIRCLGSNERVGKSKLNKRVSAYDL